MLPEGWATVVALLDGHPDADPMSRLQRLCQLCLTATGTSGMAVGLSGDGERSTVAATDTVSDRLEELQRTFSEGPGFETSAHGVPVLIADLTQTLQRWPWFAPAALEASARAMFCFPLRVGAVRFGSLTLHRATPGPLSTEQLSDARALTEAASVLLTLADPGEDSAQAFLWVLGDRSRFHAEVHQAVGATMVHLDVDAREAYARMCAYAYAHEMSIATVAEHIMARRLRLDAEQGH